VETLRKRFVDVALEWEQPFGNAPHITAALSEFDAAQLVGFSLANYCESMLSIAYATVRIARDASNLA
jgi:hypothetical protein